MSTAPTMSEQNTGIFKHQKNRKKLFCLATHSSLEALEYSVSFPDEVTPDEALDDESLVLTPFRLLLDA